MARAQLKARPALRLINCAALRDAPMLERDRLRKLAEEQLRALTKLAAAGGVCRFVVTYEEGPGSHPVNITNVDNRDEAAKLALRGSWFLRTERPEEE